MVAFFAFGLILMDQLLPVDVSLLAFLRCGIFKLVEEVFFVGKLVVCTDVVC